MDTTELPNGLESLLDEEDDYPEEELYDGLFELFHVKQKQWLENILEESLEE